MIVVGYVSSIRRYRNVTDHRSVVLLGGQASDFYVTLLHNNTMSSRKRSATKANCVLGGSALNMRRPFANKLLTEQFLEEKRRRRNLYLYNRPSGETKKTTRNNSGFMCADTYGPNKATPAG